jgi:hypothetical protein
VLLRLIGKWLNAGVLEDGCITHPEEGSPQGGVVSPMLANIFLHYVLDEWFEREVKPRLKGRSFLIRYADDFVMGFSHEEDARRVLAVLPKRFAKYGLTIHPDKTRLVPFERPDRGPQPPDAKRREPPGTFDLLGFTHFWSRSRRGDWVVKQLRGHFAYYGITGNSVALSRFRWFVTGIWRKWLSRRRRRGTIPWDQFYRMLERYPLLPPVAIHSVYRPVASS